MSPPRLYFKRTLITTSSITFELYSTQQQVSNECVCGPTLFLLLYKRYYEETGSNLNTKQIKKSSFFISYMRDGNYFDHLTFYTLRGIAEIKVGRHHLHVGSQVRQLLPKISDAPRRVNDAPYVCISFIPV